MGHNSINLHAKSVYLAHGSFTYTNGLRAEGKIIGSEK